MSAELAVEVKTRFDQLLAGCDAYYRDLERQLAAEGARPSPEPRRLEELRAALVRATELIDILESVTYDRVNRLAPR